MADILFAATPDGTRLPVIDITNPAFSAPESAADVAMLAEKALAETRRGPIQRVLVGIAMRMMARQSRLVGALQAADRGYLSGIPTYVMKLGPANTVPPYATAIDKAILASGPVTSMRIRLFGMARLLAEGLAPRLAAAPGAPLELLDIAGGPSADSLNALILLKAQGLLDGRAARVTVYDIDTDGPGFAANMLAALRTGPLAGADVSLRHVPGNWSDGVALQAVLDGFAAESIVAAASEGGLFEYGDDATIAAVLAMLAARVAVVVGSVTRDDELNRAIRHVGRAATQPRGLTRFGALIAPTGWRIAASRPAPLSDQVLLMRS